MNLCIRKCYPQLPLRGSDLKAEIILPEEAFQYSKYSVKVKVSNIGQERFDEPFRTVLYHKYDLSDSIRGEIKEFTTSGLAPGRSVQEIFEVEPNWNGYIKYFAHTDADELIIETNESNNHDSAEMTVLPFGPNLITETASPVPYENNQFRVSAKIKNNGKISARTVSEVSAYIAESLSGSKGTVICSGKETKNSLLYAGDSSRAVIQLTKTEGNGNCILERGNYVLEVKVGTDVYLKTFSFGVDRENPF